MKTVMKVIVGILAVLGAIFLLLIGVALLSEFGFFEESSDEPQVRIEYKPQYIGEQIDEEAIPDSEYYASPEQAMKNSSFQVEPEEEYQKNMDEVIVTFENENYASVYFKSIKDKNVECMTFAKFKKKVIDGEEKYTYITSFPSEKKRGGLIRKLEPGIRGQLSLSDFEQSINIDPENTRFVWGVCNSEEIYKLKVEGQEPSGIIPYESFEEQWYFWYYENLESDVAGSQLKFTLD